MIEIAQRYVTDAAEVVRTLLDAVRPSVGWGGRICDLGFGSGWLLEEMARAFPERRLFGVDMSPGMASHVQQSMGDHVSVVTGDMERLPFRGDAFDVVITCWTLYFMRDIDEALREIKRCLRPGGRLVAVTNAPDHMAEYEDLAAEALRRALGRAPEADIAARFDLDTGGPYMRRQFRDVEVLEWRGRMVLPEVEPLLFLWDSWRPESLTDADADLVRSELERMAEEWLRRERELRISRHGCAFVATKSA
jgi:SAM-dependent methyltransferase